MLRLRTSMFAWTGNENQTDKEKKNMMKIDFKKIEQRDRDIITSYFRKAPSRSCERSFANIYLWSRQYPSEWAIIEDTLVFKGEEEDYLAFSYPAGEPEKVKKALLILEEHSKERRFPFRLHNVTEEMFAQLEEWFPGKYQIEYDRDAAEYVYEREKLDTLAGKKLHAKRNHINKFKKAYEDWSYEPLSSDNVEECFQMALKWRNLNGCEEDEEKNAEACVTFNSLRLFRELELTGGVLRVNGKIVAFTLGEALCEDTFVVHIEKAYADVDGAYTMINQQFVHHECQDFKYINREDDAGMEGLRKAKRSYYPEFLVNKGIVTHNPVSQEVEK